MNPKIGIIGGKGKMGNLFATFFKERELSVIISDRGTKLSNTEVAARADIVIVSVPIAKTPDVIQQILPHVKKDSCIMDLTSIKEPAFKVMSKGDCEVLPVHPMFGASNPIPGQTVILCPNAKAGKWGSWLEKFLRKHGVKIHKMSVAEHDEMMAVVQSLIHFADISFADALRRSGVPVGELLKYAGKASELKVQLAARLIAQDEDLYGNIQMQNPKTLKQLKNFKKSINTLIKIVKKKDLQSFKKYFKENRRYLSSYANRAYNESSYLIDKHIEQKNKNHQAVLGPKNSFTSIAAQINPDPKFYTSNIEEIFDLVEKGKVKSGIAPIENKIHGTVRETLDSLFSHKVHISQVVELPINHCLITLPGTKKSQIKKIISHSQAINQCKKYLKKHFPQAQLNSYNSTSAAIEKLRSTNDKSYAAIAPSEAASGLKIYAKNIQDQADNSTKFIVIKQGRATVKNTSSDATQTSIAFYFKADSPGSLFTVFQDFSEAKINMTKIESRPTKAKFGQYIFYLDFEGNLSSPHIQKTLKKIASKVATLKILGSY